MSKSKIILIVALSGVLGGMLYRQRSAGSDSGALPSSDAAAGPATAQAVPMPEATPVAREPIDLQRLIARSPFRRSGVLQRLFDPAAVSPADSVDEAGQPLLVTAGSGDGMAGTPAPRAPQVEAVFTDRSGAWRAVIDSQRVAVGDYLIDRVTSAPYAEVIAIDAHGVDIEVLEIN